MPSCSRAVLRPLAFSIEDTACPSCGEEIKYSARVPSHWRNEVIANVYEHGHWARVEHWHTICYLGAGMPYGRPPELPIEEVVAFQRVAHYHHPKSHHSVLLAALIAHYQVHPLEETA